MRRIEAAGWTLEVPETHLERTRGLLGRTELDTSHVLVLARCSSVHTIGMRFPIDVIAFDADWSIVRSARCPPVASRGRAVVCGT